MARACGCEHFLYLPSATRTTFLEQNTKTKHNVGKDNSDIDIGQINVKPFLAQCINILQVPIYKVYVEKAWRGFIAEVRIHHRAGILNYPRIIHLNMPRDLLLIMESQSNAESKNQTHIAQQQ